MSLNCICIIISCSNKLLNKRVYIFFIPLGLLFNISEFLYVFFIYFCFLFYIFFNCSFPANFCLYILSLFLIIYYLICFYVFSFFFLLIFVFFSYFFNTYYPYFILFFSSFFLSTSSVVFCLALFF